MRLPIRLRLAIVTGVLIAVVLAGFGIFLQVRLKADLIDAVDAGLRSRAEVLLDGLDSGGTFGSGGLAERDEAFAQILDRTGRVVDSTSGLPDPLLTPQEAATITSVRSFDTTVLTAEEPTHARLLAVEAPGDVVLVVGASLDDQDEALARQLALLLFGGPLAVVLASAVGWLVAGAALRPVEMLRVEAQAVSASEPGRRLPVPATRDELSRLAEALNGMLERLEAGIQRERSFVADASHELRTPLANLRAELELALRRSRSNEELTAALRSASEEAERLARLAEDLLVLARAADGSLPLRREQTDIGTLVHDTVESFGGRASALGVELHADAHPSAQAEVDADRIRQAIGNLIDNALRHSPRGGRVEVTVEGNGATVRIAVADRGPGLSPAFLERLGHPFAREDPTRGRSAGGTGLGLAIVRAIITLHGGELRAANRPDGGAKLTLIVPA